MANKFTVIDHNFLNTGGSCMVSIFTVYDRSVNALRYVIANDEGFNVQSMDTIGHEPPEDIDYDDIILGSWDWSALTCEPSFDQHLFDEEDFLLFKHCQFEFYKEYCKYFKVKIELSVEDLPGELYNELGVEASEWHRCNEALVTTDGYKVWANDLYEQAVSVSLVEPDDYAKEIIDFSEWFDGIVNNGFATNTIEELYDKPITIVFNGRALQLGFAAAEYTAISDALKRIISEQ